MRKFYWQGLSEGNVKQAQPNKTNFKNIQRLRYRPRALQTQIKKPKKTKRKFNTIRCTLIKQRVINVAVIQNEIAFLPCPPPKPEVKN